MERYSYFAFVPFINLGGVRLTDLSPAIRGLWAGGGGAVKLSALPWNNRT